MSATPPGAQTLRAARTASRLPKIVLLVGGILACLAQFLPWISEVNYHLTNDQIDLSLPTYTVYWIPAQSSIQSFASDTLYGLPQTLIDAALIWAIPILLLVFGIAALLTRRRSSLRRLGVVGVMLPLLGTGSAVYLMLLSGFFGMDTCCHEPAKLAYGGFVALLGFLGALVGACLLLMRPGMPQP